MRFFEETVESTLMCSGGDRGQMIRGVDTGKAAEAREICRPSMAGQHRRKRGYKWREDRHMICR